jgi:methionyl-tRNA formyltransferase
MNKLNVIFMGTPYFSVPTLDVLNKNCHVLLVVTKIDSEVGRKQEIVFSPVKKYALEHNLPLFQPQKIKQDYETITNLHPDLIITCAYGQIIPKVLLDLPKYGAINIHASLLPKYRGSAPINWAIINGEDKTGITLMYMDEHMDTGDIISQKEIDILMDDNYGSLYDKLSLIGANLLENNLDNIKNNKVSRIKQDDNKATLAPMLNRDIEHLDFSLNGKDIINKIRGLSPTPSANFLLNNEEIKVLKAHYIKQENNSVSKIIEVSKDSLGISCQNGIIYLDIIKPAGKKEMNIKTYLNGQDKSKLINTIIK